MAEIEIVYREGYCEIDFGAGKCFNTQCYTAVAEDAGCKYFQADNETVGEDGVRTLAFGDCVHAKWLYKYKGWSGKNYEMEELRDPYNPHLDSMQVTLGRRIYDCVKVVLNGKIIFDEYDERGGES